MESYGWGRYPRIEANVMFPQSVTDCYAALTRRSSLIVQGMGRSYGDSSLAPEIVNTRYLNHFQAFDEENGLLTCESGVLLKDILAFIVPHGWFLSVTPGTQFVSVGGAIASDVHGKNHHVSGTFTEHVVQMELLLGNGECILVSPIENADLFYATCGGMGLTGVILSATIQLKSICSSKILETVIKCASLDEVLNGFLSHQQATYSVAWIDCLAQGKNFGRSVLRIGEHATDQSLEAPSKKRLSVPIEMPGFLLNQWTIQAFNTLYYRHHRAKRKNPCKISYESFFYPLDKFMHWNRLYGKSGFIQYQFLLPREAGVEGLRDVLREIVRSGKGSFLAVLKVFGKKNKNYLSFPEEGYSLALDFKIEPQLFGLLSQWDKLILQYGGRLYLAKDARMTEDTFKASYPGWCEFEEIRAKYHAIGKFASQQSQRLGLQ